MSSYPSVMGFSVKYLSELSMQVVAESGNWKDGHHLGKLVFKSLKDSPRDFVLQTNAETGNTRTSHAVLERTIQCASAMRNDGLKLGDVVMVLAPNHLDIAIPLYACLFNGLKFFGVDRFSRPNELAHFIQCSKPSLILCQNEKVADIKEALTITKWNAKIVTFDEGKECLTFSKYLAQADSNLNANNFKVADFDPDETISYLLATSGTTGLSKCAAVSHTNLVLYIPYLIGNRAEFPTPMKLELITSPIQWLSAISLMLVSAVYRVPTLTTTRPATEEWVADMINTYKATFVVLSPPSANSLSKYCISKNLRLESLDTIMLGGSAITTDCLEDVKKISAPDVRIGCGYGMSEIGVIAFSYDVEKSSLSRLGCLHYKLVDVQTGKEINEPNIPGELWVRGAPVFKGYYNNPQATKESFTEDGWFKTGDLLRYDERHNLVYVDRLKMLLKYKSHQISPVEVEEVISNHPAVLETAVTGIPSAEDGDLVVALVVVKGNAKVTGEEIKNIVKENLSDSKQLRGGVIFMDSIPKTATGKVDRKQLKDLAIKSRRE